MVAGHCTAEVPVVFEDQMHHIGQDGHIDAAFAHQMTHADEGPVEGTVVFEHRMTHTVEILVVFEY